ncbi:MAG: transposase [Actinomycetota bacterium]|nr:transposase [Actinomycetota bacterium]
MIEHAYTEGERKGLAVWTEDEAGPYQTVPYPGASWQPTGEPKRRPHEYVRRGTAKLLTLFHPATGEVRVRGVRRATNEVLHPWLKEEFAAILETLPQPEEILNPEHNRAKWKSWQEGLSVRITLPEELPPLRMLLVWDNLAGHLNAELLLWMFARGIMVLYTPLGGSWLNMSESIQRILVSRALCGEHPRQPEQIIEWLEAAARGWNRDPTPFEWGGRRAKRRARARNRRHALYALGGSGACTRRPIRRRRSVMEKWRHASQATH